MFNVYLIAVVAILVAYYLVPYLKWRRNVLKYIEKLPGDRRIPILGTSYKFIGAQREDVIHIIMRAISKHSPIFRSWLGDIPQINIVKPEYLEVVMNNTVHINKGSIYRGLYPWLGQGLLTSAGAKWFKHRKLITPTFHFKILENFMEVFVEKVEMLLQILDKKTDGKVFNIYTDITHCALDIICETAMGVPVNAMSNENNEYIAAIYDISELVTWRFRRPFIPDFIFNLMPKGKAFKKDLEILHGFTKRVIAGRKEVLKSKKKVEDKKEEDDVIGKKKRTSFLDLLLEASEGSTILSDTDIREEVDTFMFEGHDTTTAAMCWTLFLLGNHPDIQEKVFEEVRGILQDKSTPVTISDLHEMKYLECVIKESLRLYAIVPVIGRLFLQDLTIGEYKIPAGAEAALHIYGLHRSPECYPNPDKFDPDRFLPENSIGRHPYAFIPFSAGPRNCIGQKFAMYEEKTILSSIVNRYKLTSMEKPENIKISVDLVLRPLDGVLVKLEKRK